MSRDQPIYLSKSIINGQEQQVWASKAEAFEGGQQWDMNPVIFYRIKSPAQGTENLPVFELADHFQRKAEKEQISFTIKNADISQRDIEKVQIDDQKAVELFKNVRAITSE